jgi:hypothetical protein
MFDVFYFGKKPNLFVFEKYADNLEDAAKISRTKFFWFIYGNNDYSKFDFDWRPAPWEHTHIHVFPSQWQQDGGVYLANKDTIQNKEWHWRKEQYVKRLSDKTNWTIPETIDENSIDFSWHPSPHDPSYIYHFSSDWQETTGLIYTVPNAIEIKIIPEIPTTDDIKPLKVLDIFFVDKGNVSAGTRFAGLKDQYPTVQLIRYANSMVDTIKRCCNRTSTNRFWVISSECNYDKFNFTWHPETWQGYMTHVFPSQWNKWSDTFLINKFEFEKHGKWAKGIEEFPNLNFVTDQTVRTEGDGSMIYYVDHGNDDSPFRKMMQDRFPKLKITRFVDNYLDTFKRIVATADTEYIWITSSLCDYTNFDFSWQPEPWQSEMIHVFSSSMQKRGDTFYIHVKSFKKQMYELEMLDWFNVINYCTDQYAVRLPPPTIKYNYDSIVTAIKENDFKFPYAVFVHEQTNNFDNILVDTPCLWSPKDRQVDQITSNKSTALIPREARGFINTQVYDYPYIKEKNIVLTSDPIDIIYISNGEPDAERWYDHLLVTMNNKYSTKRLKRVKNVNGRIAAYHAAAQASETDWFFAVFAKLEVTGNFDWDWQPDYFQEPKHYIFNSQNCLNGLEYGHMGIIAYNKKLVLDTIKSGIDFTLSQPHQVVPVLSAIAYFNADPWMTWRTAFREVVKLKHFMSESPTLETEHRLHTWLTVANGDNAEWCLRGASDAVDYYNEVNGDYDKLMLSFDWPWLQERFNRYIV